MKELSPEDQTQLDVLYGMLDEGYAHLRRCSYLQRQALRNGQQMSFRVADAQIYALSSNLPNIWREISAILNPAPATPTPGPEPPKEVLQ